MQRLRRRSSVGVVAVAVMVGVALVAVTATVSAAAEKVDVCHVTSNAGDGVVISIAMAAWPEHEAHGDELASDPSVTVDGRSCHMAQLVAIDDEVTTPVGTPVTIDVLANDVYDGAVVVSVQVFPQNGILGIVDLGVFEYTPNAGFVGSDSFTYQICTTDAVCDSATVTIIVGP